MIKIRLSRREYFDPETFESREIVKGLVGVWAKRKAEPAVAVGAMGMVTPPAAAPVPDTRPLELQAVQFDEKVYSLEKALDWMDKYGYRLSQVEFALDFTSQWLEQVEAFSADEDGYVERDADLFKAGEYPDRKMKVTEADITRLASGKLPAPIYVEHQKSRFKLGDLVSATASGPWLKGKLRLFKEADALCKRLGLNTLSVAVPRTLDRVAEVSVTDSPRVTGAQMFGGGSNQSGDAAIEERVLFALGESGVEPEEVKPVDITPEEFRALKGELDAAKGLIQTLTTQVTESNSRAASVAFSLRQKEAQITVERFSAAGKLPPAVQAEAVALLLADGTVKFSTDDGEQEKSVAELFSAFLDKMPTVFDKPLTGSAKTDAALDLPEDQKAFFAKHFPDLKIEDIAKFGKGAN